MSTVLPQITELASSLLLIGATIENALDLAKQILGPAHAPKVDSGNHPDLHIYIPEGKSGLHPIANIHQLIEETALPPFEAKSKIFIIVEGEKMLPSSSNALLKTLEEPSEDTYFLLLSNHPDELLPTIRSRLFPLTFAAAQLPFTDFSPYIALACQGQWDLLLDELPEECPDDFLRSCLLWASQQKNPTLFQKVSKNVEQAEKALQHNLKPRTVFLNLLLQMEPGLDDKNGRR